MQRMRSAGTPAAPHRCCPPQHVPLRRRSVYGLVSGTLLPGRLPTPKRSGIVTRLLLTYRCGGSAGLAFVGFTGFPFHLCDREVYKHLNAASVCRASIAASTASRSAGYAGVRNVHKVSELLAAHWKIADPVRSGRYRCWPR
jgi:hypothetical protein